MLQAIRDRATGWIAYIILTLICITFALWGINSYFRQGGVQEAAVVGDTKISQSDLQRAFQTESTRLQQQTGLDPARLPGGEKGIKNRVLQRLIDDALLKQSVRDEGLRIDDQSLSAQIQGDENFHENGTFSTERYQRLLASNGMSASAYEDSVRSALATHQLQIGLAGSALLTKSEIERLIALLYQKREISYLTLSAEAYKTKATVDDAAIQKYYDDNKDRLKSPEQVKAQYLELTLEQMAKDIPVSEDDLKAEYESKKAQYTKPEERKASHILIKMPADTGAIDQARARAQTLYDDIHSGKKSFDQASLEIKDQKTADAEASDLGTISKGMQEATFEQALFNLKNVGDVSEPVKTSFGFHIIRMDAVTPEQIKPFSEVRAELEQNLRRQRAEPNFEDAAETLRNLVYENASSLQPAADKLQLKLLESDWFARGGGDGVAKFPKAVEAAFSPEVLGNRENSQALEVEPGHVIALRVLDHKQATPLSLEQARADIVTELRESQAQADLQKDAEALSKRAEQGEDLAALAKEAGGEFKPPQMAGHTEAMFDPAVLERAFRLAAPAAGKRSVGTATLANGDRAVLAISQVVPGKEGDLKEDEKKNLMRRLESQIGLSEFQSYLEARRQQVKIVTYTENF
ncbi:MAG: SurA N-terminal domain-containing protein [Gammaproteobacteria bacterium]